MTTSTDLTKVFVTSVISGTGTMIGAKYVAPIVEETAKQTAEKTKKAVEDHGNAISYGAIGGMMGSLTLNPVVAVSAASAGAALGNQCDEPGGCVVM